MKIVITGGLGFIGSNLIKYLHDKYKLLILDAGFIGFHNIESLGLDFNFEQINLSNRDKLEEFIDKDDIVIHLAAKGNVIESVENPIENFNYNVSSTLFLLDAMRKVGCKKLIFSSTGGALMGNTAPPVNELTCPSPISPYGASKLACEGYINAYSNSYGFSSYVLRFGNVYGPFSIHKKGVINKFIDNIINNKPVEVFGDLTTSRDYIHSSDIVQGIDLCIKKLLFSEEFGANYFHLSNGEEITIGMILEKLSSIIKRDIKYKLRSSRQGEVKRNASDFSKAKNELGFNPKVNLENGINDLYKWLLNNKYK